MSWLVAASLVVFNGGAGGSMAQPQARAEVDRLLAEGRPGLALDAMTEMAPGFERSLLEVQTLFKAGAYRDTYRRARALDDTLDAADPNLATVRYWESKAALWLQDGFLASASTERFSNAVESADLGDGRADWQATADDFKASAAELVANEREEQQVARRSRRVVGLLGIGALLTAGLALLASRRDVP